MCPYALFPRTLISEVPPGVCQTPDDLLRGLLREDNAAVKIPGVPDKMMGRCLRLIDMNHDFFRASGGWGLYFAYPLVYWAMPGIKNPYWAPLFLWKIRMSAHQGHLTIERYPNTGDEAEAPVFNRLLAARLNRKQNVTIDVPDEYRDENIPWEKLPEVIETTLKGWGNCAREHFIPNQLSPFVGLGDNAPQASVYPFAALGYGGFAHQSILENLDKLSQRVTANPDNMGCLGPLVSKVGSESASSTHEPPEDKDRDKYIVATADTSQESAIRNARQSRLTILQGPPGTGKSQTIVNLIADALERGDQRIAVICHHKAALSVVARRLNACGEGENKLGALATLITSPQADRLDVIRSIVDIQPTTIDSANVAAARDNACREIEETEKYLDDLNDKLRGDSPPRHRYGALRAIFDRMARERDFDIDSRANRDFCEAAKNAFPSEFADNSNIQKDLKQYLSDYRACDYGNAPWRINRDDAENIVARKIRAMLDDAHKFFNDNADNRMLLHRSTAFAEHPMLQKHFSGFSANPDLAGEYANLLTDVQNELSEVLPQATISRMFSEFREGGNSPMLETCRRHFKQWGAFVNAHNFHRNKPMLIKTIAAKCPAHGDEWLDYYDAGIAWNIYDALPHIPNNSAINAERQGAVLAKAIKEKEKQDALSVFRRFNARVTAKRNLKNDKLLKQKKGGGESKTQLRAIFHKGADDMFDIYPVLLATPDAACQMLPLKPGFFDLLIIDEASQVFTSDALPILYRAKRAVISGDEMQMPPSDFFMLAGGVADDDDDADDTAESQRNSLIPAEGEYSFLSAVQNTSEADMSRRLLVHYRSAARELIDFSNCAFYGNLLIPTGATTAPPFMKGRPIKVVTSQGTDEPEEVDEAEEADKPKINKAEIDAIIQQLREVWGSAPDAPRKYSVGVIVFNQTQHDALNRALEKQDGDFKGWLEESKNFKGDDGDDAGFFVRSVERVQGDERDIIIMGTTYGKGNRHYGPINIKGKGRRRLNVAVTRARKGMIVVTSLNIDDIASDDSRGTDRWFFWKYMQYARAVSDGNNEERLRVLGGLPKYGETQPPTGEPENEFEEQVGAFIRKCGYEVAYQVGESGFRIDIGVRASNGEFFCGVECDGASYHSGWRARHRDVWRQDILEGKGWKIVRVWSTEWFQNKDGAKEKLRTALKEAAEKQFP